MNFEISASTATAILALASLNFGIMLLVIWRIEPREQGAAFWGAALLAWAFGQCLQLTAQPGTDWAGYSIDILAVVALTLALLGTLAFVRRTGPMHLIALPAVIVGVSLLTNSLIHLDDPPTRLIHASLTMTTLGTIGALFLNAWREGRLGYHGVLGVVFTLWAAAWAIVISTEPESTIRGSTVLLRAALQMAATVTVALMAQSRITYRLRGEIAERGRAQRRFQDMVETASDWYWEIDREMRFTYVSPNIEQISGMQACAYIGKTREDLYGAKDESPGWVLSKLLFEARKPIFNLRRQNINALTGRSYVYSISAKPVFDDAGEFAGYRGTGRDLTKHEETELALEAIAGGVGAAIGTDYMRALTEHVARTLDADIVFVGRVDENRDRVRTLAFWSDGAIVDNVEYDVVGSPCAHVFDEGVRVYPAGVADLFPQDAALRRRGIQGYVGAPLLDASGQPIGNIVLLTRSPIPNPRLLETVIKALAPRAASELQRQIADELLRASQRRFREILDNMPIGFVLKTGSRFIMVNRTFADWAGISQQEAEAMTDKEIRDRLGWPQQTQDEVAANQLKVLQSGRPNMWERRLPMAGGQSRIMLGVTFPLGDSHGEDAVIGAAMSDVTELRELQSSLIQAQKMDALGRLAGGIAHDFNNIVGAIVGYSRFIAEDAEPGSNARQYSERIQAASNRAKDLIQQILAFSRRTELARVPVRVNQLIEEAANLLKATLPATTRLDIDTGRSDIAIEADATQMAQVLLNICVNANDALGGRQGHVNLVVTTHDGREAVAAVGGPETVHSIESGGARYSVGSIASERPYVSIAVGDNGDGMTPETLQRIFEPFFTTKPKGQGTGLGLPVVHGIVLAHGGAITVESMRGYGTTFRIWLPMVECAKASIAAEGPTPAPFGKGRILVIDDDVHFGDMVGVCLERLGYEAGIIDNPTEALATFEEDPTFWDLILADQTMPELSGIETIQRIKRQRPSIPCILCTGFSHPTNEETARAAGADAYLTKPVDLATLAQIVAHLIRDGDAAGANLPRAGAAS